MRTGKDMVINDRDKKVAKIIHRLLSEECTKLTTISGKISTLNHQSENFHRMDEVTQDEVLKDVKKLMLENTWHSWVNELEEEFLFGGKNV